MDREITMVSFSGTAIARNVKIIHAGSCQLLERKDHSHMVETTTPYRLPQTTEDVRANQMPTLKTSPTGPRLQRDKVGIRSPLAS